MLEGLAPAGPSGRAAEIPRSRGFGGRAAGYRIRMDLTTAFLRSDDTGATEIVVNFGPLAGREATLAEVDRLARRLLGAVEYVRVHAVRSHEMSAQSESIVHQVVVQVPDGSEDLERLREMCEAWAAECAAERSVEPIEL